MELFVHRFIFAAAIAITLTAAGSLRSQTTTPANRQVPAMTEAGNGVQADASSEAAKEAALAQMNGVYQELSKMVPGGITAGSPMEKSLTETIELFATRKPQEALQSLKDLAATEQNISTLRSNACRPCVRDQRQRYG